MNGIVDLRTRDLDGLLAHLAGRPIIPSILDAPDPVDLAILLIPAPAIPHALGDCDQRGLKAAIIGSGGFRETGPEGAQLEAECLNIARSHQMRLVGPNCIGLLDTHLPMDATFLPPPGPLPGDVAFVSHSGAICAAVIDWARGQSFGLSRLVSLGNQVDVNETDVLAPVAADPFTRVLTLYLEGVSDGRRFVSEASRITQEKPIIALKVERHYGWKGGVPAYALASAVAVSRLQRNKHYLSDVMAGATLGYLVGRTVVRANSKPLEAPRAPQFSLTPVMTRHSRTLVAGITF